MLRGQIHREAAARAQRDPRHARDITAVACAVVGVPFGPVRLGHDCLGESDGATTDGQPTAWQMTANRDAIVPYFSRA